MLRITPSGFRRVRTMDLDGKLVGPWVDELRRAVGSPDDGESVCLNLAHLTFADSAGLGLLQELHRSGAQLVGALPLIRGLLDSRTGPEKFISGDRNLRLHDQVPSCAGRQCSVSE